MIHFYIYFLCLSSSLNPVGFEVRPKSALVGLVGLELYVGEPGGIAYSAQHCFANTVSKVKSLAKQQLQRFRVVY